VNTKPSSIIWLLLGLAAVFIIFWGVRSMAFILAPLAMAMVITIAMIPLPGWLKQRKVPGSLSIILTILAVIAVMVGVVLIVVFSMGKLAATLPEYTANAAQQQAAASTASSSSSTATPLDQAASALQGMVSPQMVNQLAAALVEFTAKAIAQVVVVMFIFAFMLTGALSLERSKQSDLGLSSPMVGKVEQYTTGVRRYTYILTIINFLVALGDTLLLLIMGIDYALLWGLLAFLLGYIPSIGFWIALIPPVFLAYVQYGLPQAIVVFAAYVLINGGVQNIVQPRMMGKGLQLSPLLVFVSFIFWTTLLGGMGALIAVPLTLLVKALLEISQSTRWLAALMSIGSESESGESQQAVERLKGLGGSLRDLIPFGNRGEKEAFGDKQPAGDPQPVAGTQPVGSEGSAP
jgi:AI-2 transport protein TqsA